MAKPPAEFMEKYKVDSDEVWQVPDGAWVVKHKALERVAAEQKIVFDPPTILTTSYTAEGVALLVTGHMGDRAEWSIGEASTFNLTRKSEKRPLYPWAMSEKRAKDRVILKLLNTHGALYSEAESDEFEKRQNPHVTTPNDISEPIEYDEQGHPVDNIPLGDPSIDTLPKKDARKDWSLCEKEIRSLTTERAFENWGKTNANRVQSFPPDWAELIRRTFRDCRDEMRAKSKQEAA